MFLCMFRLPVVLIVGFTIQTHQLSYHFLKFFLDYNFRHFSSGKKNTLKEVQLFLLACWCFNLLLKFWFAMHILDRKACASVIITEPNFIKILFALELRAWGFHFYDEHFGFLFHFSLCCKYLNCWNSQLLHIKHTQRLLLVKLICLPWWGSSDKPFPLQRKIHACRQDQASSFLQSICDHPDTP